MKENIVHIITTYLNLKKTGKNYIALCPFHNEKTASFTVTEEKQFFYCFGCGIGGNVEIFLKLCRKKNIYRKKKTYTNNIKTSTKKNNFTTEKYITWYKKIIENSILELKKSNDGLTYCLKRNIGLNVLEMFSIGYIPQKTNNTFFKKYKKNKTLRMFLNKIVFPIKSTTGFILGIGGRVIKENIKPKYINIENTKLFEKKKIIFGLYEYLKYSETNHKFLLLVEGYFDVLSLFSNGITNTISTLGTTLSIEQLELIFKYTNEIFFCYDGDVAGYTASSKNIKKIINICKSKKIKIKNIKLPNNTDPDSFINLEGIKKFKKLIEETPYII